MEVRRRLAATSRLTGTPRPVQSGRGLAVSSSVRGGKLTANHNQALGAVRGVKVRSSVQAGKLAANHNQVLRAAS